MNQTYWKVWKRNRRTRSSGPQLTFKLSFDQGYNSKKPWRWKTRDILWFILSICLRILKVMHKLIHLIKSSLYLCRNFSFWQRLPFVTALALSVAIAFDAFFEAKRHYWSGTRLSCNDNRYQTYLFHQWFRDQSFPSHGPCSCRGCCCSPLMILFMIKNEWSKRFIPSVKFLIPCTLFHCQHSLPSTIDTQKFRWLTSHWLFARKIS